PKKTANELPTLGSEFSFRAVCYPHCNRVHSLATHFDASDTTSDDLSIGRPTQAIERVGQLPCGESVFTAAVRVGNHQRTLARALRITHKSQLCAIRRKGVAIQVSDYLSRNATQYGHSIKRL